MSDTALSPQSEAPRHRIGLKGYAWRVGLLLIWVPLILLPIFFFVLATQGEIAVWHGAGMPAGSEHPIVQVKLLMEIDTRGLNITRSFLASDSARTACVQTDVSFLLWQGSGDPASYCDCYQRAEASQPWRFSSSAPGICTG